MYLLIILAGIPVLWLFIMILLEVSGSTDDFTGGWIGLFVVSLIFGAVFFLVQFTTDSSQVSDIEELAATQERIEVYEGKTNALTKAFEDLLSEKYPNHEAGIFDKISPDNIEIYLAKFPEIRSGETFINLTDKVLLLNEQLYAEKIELTDLKQDIRYRLRNPWIFQSFITDLSPEQHRLVYNEK